MTMKFVEVPVLPLALTVFTLAFLLMLGVKSLQGFADPPLHVDNGKLRWFAVPDLHQKEVQERSSLAARDSRTE